MHLALHWPLRPSIPADHDGEDELIHWDDSFSVGNALLDNENREIVGVLNTLYRHHGDGGAPLDSKALLDRVGETIAVHFANEEDVMARHHCPTLEPHHRIHGELLAELAGTAATLPHLPPQEAEAVLTRLMRRLVINHILVDDMDCRTYLRE